MAKLKITQADLELSIKRRETGLEELSECCVVSTAAQRQFSNEDITSVQSRDSNMVVYMLDKAYLGSRQLARIADYFDSGEYKKIKVGKTYTLILT